MSVDRRREKVLDRPDALESPVHSPVVPTLDGGLEFARDGGQAPEDQDEGVLRVIRDEPVSSRSRASRLP